MDVAARPHIDLLIAEARRRARRRRLLAAAAAAAAAATVWLLLGGGGAPHNVASAGRSAPLPSASGLTIISGDIYAVGGGALERKLWACGPKHRCWEPESLAWSPDGRRLAFGGVSLGGAVIYDGLHVVDVRTGAVAIIRRVMPNERHWLDVAWSPDGTRIAFVSNRTIFLVRADGSGFRLLHTGTEGSDRAPTWSPNSRRLAYEVQLPRESRVYTIGVDGSRRDVVARNASWPSWSPDGKTIAYRGCGGIRLVTPAGRDVTPSSGTCPHIGLDAAPVWSPDGTRIAMAVWRDGTYVMSADGSGLHRVGPPPQAIPASVRNSWLRPAWRPALTVTAPARFPTGTFLTKITTADLYRAGWHEYNDAHWETLTLRPDGTWRDVWFHPRVRDQPPATGRYSVSGDTVRFLGTPDVVRWHYAAGRLTFRIVHVPDALARIGYTAHAWRKIG